MRRFAFFLATSAAVAMAATSALALTLQEVAGQWSGMTARGTKVVVNVGADGKFSASTGSANGAGQAVIKGETVVLDFGNGSFNLKKNGSNLSGDVIYLGKPTAVTLSKQ
ncbi:MAG: hypothetical protein JSS04_06365 [Proteobacteria bacterium]|nr:hypothetical protein [Pseudomonadota bacterium]